MRRLRASLGIALVWGLAWLPIGFAVALYASASPSHPSNVVARPVSLPAFVSAWTVWGVLSGAAFALILGLTERRGTVDSLSIVRTVLWGAMGAVSLPLLLVASDLIGTPAGLRGYSWQFPLLILSVSAAMGACCAAATLALARRTT